MKYRQVLFLGNGINRAFGSVSWTDLLNKMNKTAYDPDIMHSPMPLRIQIITNNNVKEGINENRDLFFGSECCPEQTELLFKLLTHGFDDILTTNYSYELEAVARGRKKLSNGVIEQMAENAAGGRVEPKYLLHSFNKVVCGGTVNRVWHVHGECRKPDSIVIGHSWYGNLLFKLKEELNRKGNHYAMLQRDGKPIEFDSWIDSFLLGDVHMLGFSFDFSEFDLWWLLNRRYYEKAEKGALYYYDSGDTDDEKKALLRLLGVEIVSFPDFSTVPEDSNERALNFKNFYRYATSCICKGSR